MPFAALTIVPGVNVEKTPLANEAGVSAAQGVRWRAGMAEKRGGYAKFVNATLAGTPRALHAWQDLANVRRLAVGATSNLTVVTNGNVVDLTAQSAIVNIAVAVDTTNGSKTVTVHDTGRNATIYTAVAFNTPVSVGGIVLSGAYQIVQQNGADSYNIVASANATSTVAAGGAVPSFATTTGSANVTVTLSNHGYFLGQNVAFLVSTTVGGVTIFGQYVVNSVPTANSFVIGAANAATATTTGSMNGGNVSLTYYVAIGPSNPGSGFGIGGFGSGGFGTGTPQATGTAPPITATDYWLDNFGQILLSAPEGGPLFFWSPDSGYANSAIVPQAPRANSGFFVAMPQQQVMAWGSTHTGVSDPLQIRWSDAVDFTVWTATAINQAGGYRIPTGSRIVRGVQGPQQTLWWTDVDLYAGQYVGLPFIWGFNKIATGCGLIAPKAVGILGSTVFWMSQKQFFVFAGAGVEPIECPVWDAVFQNLDTAHLSNIRCAPNSYFNEISWDFPSAASADGENDTRVTYNKFYNEWDVQPINRSAWVDQSVLGAPIGTNSSGRIYQHEVSPDADGIPLAASLTTGYFALAEGQIKVFVDWLMPDMTWGTYSSEPSAAISITFNVVDFPGETPRVFGPFTVTRSTRYISPRFRGRYMQFVIASNDAGSFWRLGKIRYRWAPDGRV